MTGGAGKTCKYHRSRQTRQLFLSADVGIDQSGCLPIVPLLRVSMEIFIIREHVKLVFVSGGQKLGLALVCFLCRGFGSQIVSGPAVSLLFQSLLLLFTLLPGNVALRAF